MNGASLCNSISLHSHSLFRFHPSSSSSSSSTYLIPPNFTTSTFLSISHRNRNSFQIRQSFRVIVNKSNNGFRLFAGKNRRDGGSKLMESENSITGDEDVEEEDEDEDWDEFDLEGDGEEDDEEGEFLPMEKMKKWLERKPRGFGVGRKYETSIEDKLLDEIEQSWKAQAANLNKLKNNPLKPQQQQHLKGEETQNGYRVRVSNLPKKKNVHRDLKVCFKEVVGILNIEPAVSGNKKTKDPVCKGFAFLHFKTEIDANRFVEEFTGQRLAFGKVIKQIKCQVVDSSLNQTDSEEDEYSSKGLSEKTVSNAADVVVEDAFLESDDDSEAEEDETDCVSSSVESFVEVRRDSETDLKPRKQEIREHVEELETSLVSYKANKPEETAVEIPEDDQHDAEDSLERMKSSRTSTEEEERIDRIRRLELKLLGRGDDSDEVEAKPVRVKKEKKKKKIVVKGQAKKSSSKIEIPGSSKRLKVKEKALLTGVLEKYAARAGSTSNE